MTEEFLKWSTKQWKENSTSEGGAAGKRDSNSFYRYGSSDKLTTLGVDFKINGKNIDERDKGSVDIPSGIWNYLVVTYDGSVLKAYVNADLNYTLSLPGRIDHASSQCQRAGAERCRRPNAHLQQGKGSRLDNDQLQQSKKTGIIFVHGK